MVRLPAALLPNWAVIEPLLGTDNDGNPVYGQALPPVRANTRVQPKQVRSSTGEVVVSSAQVSIDPRSVPVGSRVTTEGITSRVLSLATSRVPGTPSAVVLYLE